MSRSQHSSTAAARDAADLDRLAQAVLSAALDPGSAAPVPGGPDVHRNTAPAADPRPRSQRRGRGPGRDPGGGRNAGRPSTHGHAPGAQAIPRWK